MHHRPTQLSGGQQQRVAIARALVNDPKMLLADEPTGALDSRTSLELMALFQELNREGATIVIVTHEPDVARFADAAVRFRDGHVIGDARRSRPMPRAASSPSMPVRGRRMTLAATRFVSALDALRLHKLRSALTMLGIIIGVAAVIAMVAVGGGAREQVVAQIRSLGANLLIVMPGNITQGGVRLGSGAASTLTDDDSAAIVQGGPDRAGRRAVHARRGADDRRRRRTGRRPITASISAGSRRANGRWRRGRMFEPEEIARGAAGRAARRDGGAESLRRRRSGRRKHPHPQRAASQSSA